MARCFLEASCYLEELGAMEEAISLLRRAASMGSVEAQVNLGVAFSYGMGVDQDEGISRQWLKRAAQAGSSQGAHNLALSYLEHDDPRWAIYWFKRADALGDEDARAYLDALEGVRG
ncbi:tetratricopeptide repeat protein [Dyella terrae]|nr:SEL1-like repeat protein [Dyella terrae]